MAVAAAPLALAAAEATLLVTLKMHHRCARLLRLMLHSAPVSTAMVAAVAVRIEALPRSDQTSR